MKRTIPLVLDMLSMLTFALWIGSLAGCWMLAAPSLRFMPPDALKAGEHALYETLRRLGSVVEICGVTLAGIQWVLRRRYQRVQQQFVVDAVRTLVLFAALLCAEYGRYVLIPNLMRTGTVPVYTVLSVMAAVQGALLIVFAALTVWLQSPLSMPAIVPAAVSAQPARAPSGPSRAPQNRAQKRGK